MYVCFIYFVLLYIFVCVNILSSIIFICSTSKTIYLNQNFHFFSFFSSLSFHLLSLLSPFIPDVSFKRGVGTTVHPSFLFSLSPSSTPPSIAKDFRWYITWVVCKSKWSLEVRFYSHWHKHN